jgi:DnaJ-class molecular chaperone
MNPYTILKIDKGASKDDIRKAYIKLAMIYHPDKNRHKTKEERDRNESTFKEINNAYELLNKKSYTKYSDTKYSDTKYSDIADRIFKEAKLFGKFFFDKVQEETEDINVNLNLDINDIYNNIEKEFSLKIKRKCKKCMGMGINLINKEYESCLNCLGEKYKLTDMTFKINAGEGRHIFFKKSHEEYGKRTGHVLINIIPKNMKNYKIINHSDLLLNLYSENIREFKHLDNVKYTINDPPISNTIYSVKNMGLYDNDLNRGTLYIQYLNEILNYKEITLN